MGILVDSYAAQQNSLFSQPSMQAGSAGSGSSAGGSSAGTGMVAAGVISGLSQIANSWIDANRRKSALRFNAGMAEIEGRMIKLSARIQMQRIREESDKLFSKQRTAYAKAGVTFDGSPSSVMAASLAAAEEDAIMTEINANYQASQKGIEGMMYKGQAKQQKYSAMLDTTNSILNMGMKAYARG